MGWWFVSAVSYIFPSRALSTETRDTDLYVLIVIFKKPTNILPFNHFTIGLLGLRFDRFYHDATAPWYFSIDTPIPMYIKSVPFVAPSHFVTQQNQSYAYE